MCGGNDSGSGFNTSSGGSGTGLDIRFTNLSSVLVGGDIADTSISNSLNLVKGGSELLLDSDEAGLDVGVVLSKLVGGKNDLVVLGSSVIDESGQVLSGVGVNSAGFNEGNDLGSDFGSGNVSDGGNDLSSVGDSGSSGLVDDGVDIFLLFGDLVLGVSDGDLAGEGVNVRALLNRLGLVDSEKLARESNVVGTESLLNSPQSTSEVGESVVDGRDALGKSRSEVSKFLSLGSGKAGNSLESLDSLDGSLDSLKTGLSGGEVLDGLLVLASESLGVALNVGRSSLESSLGNSVGGGGSVDDSSDGFSTEKGSGTF